MKKDQGVIYQRNKQTTKKDVAQNVSVTDKNIGNKASKELETLAVGASRIILDI